MTVQPGHASNAGAQRGHRVAEAQAGRGDAAPQPTSAAYLFRNHAAVALVLALAACGGNGADAAENAPSAASASAAAPSLSDAEIAAVVVAANAVDAEMGDFAAERSANPAVQEFARAMARDHRAVNDNAAALVTKLGVTPVESDLSRKLRSDAANVRASLQQQTGAAFDRAYITHEIAYHKAVIDAVDTVLLPNTQNAELKRAIENVRPALVAHLQHAEHLLREL